MGKQLTLIKERKYEKRKVARALSLRGANHVVLKASAPILRRHHSRIKSEIRKAQDRFSIRIRALAIMPDHIHLILKVSSRVQFANALRMLAGQIALKVKGTKLWKQRVWSRPVKPGRDQENATLYVARNSIKSGHFSDADAFYIVNGVLQI